MNKILLIDRLNPESKSEEKNKVFFMLGGMNEPEVEEKIMDAVVGSNIIDSDHAVLKYNGIELEISVQEIPYVTRSLVEKGFSVYGVYQIYTPYEDMI